MSTQNDFSQGRVAHHIMSLAVPMTLAQLVQMAYNLVDRIYIGHLPGASTLALTGLGLTFPIITIIMACTNLFGTGGTALYAIARGKKDEASQGAYLGNTFLALCLSSLVLLVLCFALMRPILYVFGASDATYPYAAAYLRLYLLGTPFIMLATGLNGFINAQGFGKTGMCTILIGALINIVLDPIFIFLFGLGISGAAIATVISQGLSAAWVLAFLCGRRSLTPLRPRAARLEGAVVKQIAQLGMAGFFMQATNGIVQIAANRTLGIFGGDVYIGIMTVLQSVREVISLPMHGLTNAAQPVIGYNLGAGKKSRIWQALRFVTPVNLVYTSLCWLVIFLFPQQIMSVFNTDPELLAKGAPAMHLFFFGFFMMAFHSTGQSTFVGLGKSKQASFFALFRKVLIVVPLTLLLPRVAGLGVMGVFLAEPVSNVISGILCYSTMLWTLVHLDKKSLRHRVHFIHK